MNEPKPTKTAEVSLGYISWSLKEMSESMRKTCAIAEEMLQLTRDNVEMTREAIKRSKNDELPF